MASKKTCNDRPIVENVFDVFVFIRAPKFAVLRRSIRAMPFYAARAARTILRNG